MVAAPIHHINLDERSIAYVAGTSMKVAHIAIDAQTWGMTPQEIQDNYPHLSLGGELLQGAGIPMVAIVGGKSIAVGLEGHVYNCVFLE